MVKLEEAKGLYNFEPKYDFWEVLQYLPERFRTETVRDGRLYEAVKALTEKAHPTEVTDFEKRWRGFYLPLKRRRYFILVPLDILLYRKKFFLSFMDSQLEVCKGREKNSFFSDLVQQALKVTRILRKDPGIVAKALPYDIRTGRVLGKYVMEDLLPAETKDEVLKLYGDHVRKDKKSYGVLSDYLNIAALCYRAAFGGKTRGLTPVKMYRKWADGRDCGMLEIRNKRSRKAFAQWQDSGSNCGGHPFEIVFSWLGHGIHLYPPYEGNPYMTLSVTDYMFAFLFLDMVRALVRNGVPFRAHALEGVLDYLSGESYFTVNAYGEHSIRYSSGDRKLFKHIEWDAPGMLRWK